MERFIFCVGKLNGHITVSTNCPRRDPAQRSRASLYYWKGVIKAVRYVFISRPFSISVCTGVFWVPIPVQCKVITSLYGRLPFPAAMKTVLKIMKMPLFVYYFVFTAFVSDCWSCLCIVPKLYRSMCLFSLGFRYKRQFFDRDRIQSQTFSVINNWPCDWRDCTSATPCRQGEVGS